MGWEAWLTWCLLQMSSYIILFVQSCSRMLLTSSCRYSKLLNKGMEKAELIVKVSQAWSRRWSIETYDGWGFIILNILLHDWEGNMGKYSVWDRPYRPNRMEGRYRGQERNISLYCLTRGIAIIYLFYDFRFTIGTGNNERAIQGNIAL